MCGFVDLRICGCADLRIYGFMDLWIYGLGIKGTFRGNVQESGSRKIWPYFVSLDRLGMRY